MSQLGERIAKIEQALTHVEATQATVGRDINEIKQALLGNGGREGLIYRVSTLEKIYRYTIVALAVTTATALLPLDHAIALLLRVVR